jgi:hypothetical protein
MRGFDTEPTNWPPDPVSLWNTFRRKQPMVKRGGDGIGTLAPATSA